MFGRQWTNEAKIAIFNYPTLITIAKTVRRIASHGKNRSNARLSQLAIRWNNAQENFDHVIFIVRIVAERSIVMVSWSNLKFLVIHLGRRNGLALGPILAKPVL